MAALAGRSKFTGEPPSRISPKRVYGKRNLLQGMTGRAFEGVILKPPFARTDPSQLHPVLACRAHWPIGDKRIHDGVTGNNRPDLQSLSKITGSKTQFCHNCGTSPIMKV